MTTKCINLKNNDELKKKKKIQRSTPGKVNPDRERDSIPAKYFERMIISPLLLPRNYPC